MSLQDIVVATGRNARRSARPERIDLGDGDVAVRNDVVAAMLGVSEKSLNRLDPQGAAFLMVMGVKYRIFPRFLTWFTKAKTVVRCEETKRRRSK
jgi:hypothetical protein